MSTDAHAPTTPPERPPRNGRYAPSPTGELHLGNLRTALAAWLDARASGGTLQLRIDDLDPDRSRSELEIAQLADLQSLGLAWDGEPVRQSGRSERYAAALETMRRLELAYPCFCSRAEVRSAASAPHAADAPPGAYPGTCSTMASSVAERRIECGDAFCLRARAGGANIEYVDALLGSISALVDDFVIRRRDGVPAYNLATVVDDHDMAIDTVARGADLAETTPRQLWLAAVLQLRRPEFLHVPLVLGPDGARLSKRHGSVGLSALSRLGIDAGGVLRLLGESLGLVDDADEAATLASMTRRYRRDALPRREQCIDPAALHSTPAARWRDMLVR